MASKPRQIKNPYIRFGRTAQGPYAQSLGSGFHGRSIALGQRACFYLTSAIIGDPNPEEIILCFNEVPEFCSTTTIWDWYSNGVLLTDTTFLDPSGNCLRFRATRIIDGDGPSDLDLITMDHTPGNCQKQGDPECQLEAFTGMVVTNRILGVSSMNIGIVADNVVDISLTADAATIGNRWTAEVNGGPVGVAGSAIVGGNIQLTLSVTPSSTDVVTINHTDVTNGAVAVDGRMLYQFADYPVGNSIGANFWIREDLGQWQNEQAGRWQLES